MAIFFGVLYFTNNTEKNREIEGLKADASDKAEYIETLNADIAIKNDAIVTLNKVVNEKALQIETLDADISEKVKQIEDLSVSIEEKANYIGKLNSEAEETKKQIASLFDLVDEKTEQIVKLQLTLEEKEKLIETLQSEKETIEKQLAEIKENTVDKSIEAQTTIVPSAENVPVESTKPIPTGTPVPVTVPVIDDIKSFEIPDNKAMALMRDMKSGWNLGNTFDAFSGYSIHAKGISMETSWVNAKTTQKLIAAVKEAGFNTIRIPVSWHNHVDENDVIDREWIERVKEVADWALDLGMYVIVNVHHDNDVKYLYPDSAHYDRSAAYMTSVWTQMAETFRDCDDHLILESMNEPRLVGNVYEWYWRDDDAACQDAAECINRLNQLFVDTVRASGGNNATRYLAVPAYCAAPQNACNSAFVLPKDIIENRIIVSVHAYTPYEFALSIFSSDREFDLEKDQGKKNEISGFLDSLYNRFVKNGVPVMIDEFGALDKQGNLQARVNFTAYYVASASARGITCVWWDNHGFSGNGERFGLIRRVSVEWVFPQIVQAIQEYCLYNRK
uniref:Cellulase n=1 Tax=uncultured bacterium Contig203 TaxID=1393530 RepID=W0FJC1_9BACT|nr:cellulase [uncultured bacterium Contig203]